jgi:hypothetical protein
MQTRNLTKGIAKHVATLVQDVKYGMKLELCKLTAGEALTLVNCHVFVTEFCDF